jgi:hypothetical protein
LFSNDLERIWKEAVVAYYVHPGILPRETEKKIWKAEVRKDGFPAKMKTWHDRRRGLERYRCTNLLGLYTVKVDLKLFLCLITKSVRMCGRSGDKAAKPEITRNDEGNLKSNRQSESPFYD